MYVDRSLEINIPNKFKKNMHERFNIENAKKEYPLSLFYDIEISCDLCLAYRENLGPRTGGRGECGDCPFQEFEKKGGFGDTVIIGCFAWIIGNLDHKPVFNITESRVSFSSYFYDKVEKQFQTLKEAAEELITWV